MPTEDQEACEKVVRAVIYATRCRYEGHESYCNVYGCVRHEHPEVKAVRSMLRRALREARKAGAIKALMGVESECRVASRIGIMEHVVGALAHLQGAPDAGEEE